MIVVKADVASVAALPRGYGSVPVVLTEALAYFPRCARARAVLCALAAIRSGGVLAGAAMGQRSHAPKAGSCDHRVGRCQASGRSWGGDFPASFRRERGTPSRFLDGVRC